MTNEPRRLEEMTQIGIWKYIPSEGVRREDGVIRMGRTGQNYHDAGKIVEYPVEALEILFPKYHITSYRGFTLFDQEDSTFSRARLGGLDLTAIPRDKEYKQTFKSINREGIYRAKRTKFGRNPERLRAEAKRIVEILEDQYKARILDNLKIESELKLKPGLGGLFRQLALEEAKIALKNYL